MSPFYPEGDLAGTPVSFSRSVRKRRCSQVGQDVLRQKATVLRYVPRVIRIMHAQKSAPFSRRAPDVLACLHLVDEAVLEARLRADTAFSQGGTDVERLIRHYLARRPWVNDRVRQAAVHEASAVIQVGPDDTVDAVVTRTVQRLWPEEASS
jgi:hypothetical protein